jgi:divinyl chlorophyllide a 8-vinyl-reductase
MNSHDGRRKTVLVVGATGYIGRAVVAEAVQQGHDVVAVTRSPAGAGEFAGAEVVVADVTDPASVGGAFHRQVDVVISCLACRSGTARDFDAIDYQATRHVLEAALHSGARHFILLSAICVRKPDLPLQLAKLKMEDELIRSGMDYTIVRPTAYFWVFDGQARLIRKGWPGFLVGDGDQAVHNPIAREDLAEFMVGSIDNAERRNRLFIIGGPETAGNIVSYRDALAMIFESMGREPKLVCVPNWMVRAVIHVVRFAGIFWRRASALAETLKIVHYYTNNDMRAPGYGSRTLRQHLLATGGREEIPAAPPTLPRSTAASPARPDRPPVPRA